ncbi:unnamed protein product [Rotaria magnacalcarata]|uniref:EGF-like domain-containing protein n=1 Tax=Rotaria magnacalcarata TaxID=392030 RepID=A0A819H6T7_9BILA|nr:unnamed protein product [Rotaria magnacalcarata]CAF2271588.1 unnamed protein product [Rotaria magnacalcarata]CAF3893677.1 unnamed protein product [Rotaria magnacalcarata]CAF4251686.1 unnamed protein product [Rotaria magnacalcarata]
MNQCAQNEYQCRNGMCTNQVFLLEVGISYSQDYECLDQSDETSEPGTMKRCEDTICRFPNTLIWGDGDCIPWSVPNEGHSCYNNRDQVFNYDFEWHNEQIAFQAKQLKNIDRLHSKQAWLCHRGILIYYGKNESEKCLCPPSYYGSRCQYQNQRVSLTL